MLVIQEWWGLVPHIKNVCDRLAVGEPEGEAARLRVILGPDQRQWPESLAVDQVAGFVDDREHAIAGDTGKPEMSALEMDEGHRLDRGNRDPGDAPCCAAHAADHRPLPGRASVSSTPATRPGSHQGSGVDA